MRLVFTHPENERTDAVTRCAAHRRHDETMPGVSRTDVGGLTRRGMLGAVAALGGAVALSACNSSDEGNSAASSPSGALTSTPARTPLKHPAGLSYGTTLRADSALLEAGSTRAVLVEFLDFQCPACAGVYPVMEQLRRDLAGKMTYAVRHFPLEVHPHARPAALAVEAAGLQGRWEPMYEQLFGNHKQWAQQQGSVDGLLREFAQVAGVDVTRWDTDRRSAAVARRVDRDVADGKTLSISGTPSFFFNGKPFQPESADDIRDTITKADQA